MYTCEASNEMGQVFAVLDLQDSVALPHIEEEEEVMMMDSTHTSHHASAAASPGPALATLLLVLATQRLVPLISTYLQYYIYSNNNIYNVHSIYNIYNINAQVEQCYKHLLRPLHSTPPVRL